MSTFGKVIAWAILGPIVILFIAICGYEARKAYYDSHVRELCAKDGGMKVYETVTLPAERFDRYGEVRFREKRYAKSSDDFYYVWDVSDIRSGNPLLSRNHFKLYRRMDEKLLAEGIGYFRRGGDIPIPLPINESSYQCPDSSGYSVKYMAQKVFIESKIKEPQK